jgi:hypothetical protein
LDKEDITTLASLMMIIDYIIKLAKWAKRKALEDRK